MRIIINSNYNFYEKSLPVLLPNLIGNNCNLEVVIGGSPWEYKKEIKDGVNYHFVKYDSIDFTSFIFVSENIKLFKDETFFLYIHDTTKAGPLFFQKLQEKINFYIQKYESVEEFNEKNYHIQLTGDCVTMNMGLYRVDFFELPVIKELLKTFKNTDLSDEGRLKNKKLGFENEDILFKKFEGRFAVDSLNTAKRIVTEIPSPYSTDVERIQEYFPGLDFYKYKSNWVYWSRVIKL